VKSTEVCKDDKDGSEEDRSEENGSEEDGRGKEQVKAR
jgi:hypothetical protein